MRSVIGLLASFVDVETAGKVFAIIATLMPAAGACVLSWRLQTASPICRSLVSLSYSMNRQAAGLAIIAFAAWVRADGWQPHAVCRVFFILAGAWEMASAISKSDRLSVSETLKKIAELLIILLPVLTLVLVLFRDELSYNVTTFSNIVQSLQSVGSPFWMRTSRLSLLLGLWIPAAMLAAIGLGV